MKRFRVRVVGLGLALAAGSAAASDEWRPPGQPAPAVTAGAPGLLPPALRATGASSEPGTIWLPAREPGATFVVPAGGAAPVPEHVVMPPAPVQQPRPQPQPTKWPPEPAAPGAVGPRFGGNASSALPAIPVPEVPVQPEAPRPAERAAPAPRQPAPVPVAPKPAVVDPQPMVQPRAPEFLPPAKADPLPTPRPVEAPPAPPARSATFAPPQPELQPAPPELMYPAGALELNKRGTFGSLPIRLSRDYPSLQSPDLTISGGRDALASRVYARGEYLLWWMPGFPTPVLATTNPDPAFNGYFGEPGTTAILGPGALVGSTRSGFRFRAGMWLDDAHSCGIDAGFFFLGNLSESAVRDSSQFPIITRPIFSPNVRPDTGTVLGEFGEAVAFPGILRGTLTARGESQLWGADVNVRKCWFTKCDSRAEWFVGYRHLNLRESLSITEDITVIGDGGGRIDLTDPVGTRVVVQDRFATRNQFHGGQIGAAYERRFGRWDVDARASVALGTTHQTLDINAIQVRQRPGEAPMTFRGGGLLAAGPNIGRFERDKFSVAPELTLNVGYWVTPHFRVFAGYNFLLWTNVIRPGDQIDRVVDISFVPNSPPAPPSGLQRPRPLFTQRDLVVNGIQVGLEWRW